MNLFQDTVWNEPTSSRRGLKRPTSAQQGMLEFSPATVQPTTISKFCSKNGRVQRLAILEWGLVNPEKITEFLNRMKKDSRFRSHYHGVYDAIRLLHKRVFDFSSDVVVASENKWKSKLEIALDEERSALDRCEAEIAVRRSRVAWLKKVQSDDLGDRYLWRKGMEALPSWKSKTARHAAKRKAVRSEAQGKLKKGRLMIACQTETL